ncbi:hypothetical protein SBV1_2470023 [Verrucomicrobia bacterium]|nr:hypothetical protein SBV1_2470023 [Verrucomicrobiota bacterium]
MRRHGQVLQPSRPDRHVVDFGLHVVSRQNSLLKTQSNRERDCLPGGTFIVRDHPPRPPTEPVCR